MEYIKFDNNNDVKPINNGCQNNHEGVEGPIYYM